jgi:YbbR domain-containing protein
MIFSGARELLLHNLGTKLISLVIATVLWVIVLGSRSIEVTKEVPLEITTAADLVVANEVPATVAFRLAGPKAFLRAIVDRRMEPVRVDLSGARPGKVEERFFSDDIRLPPGVRVLAINPASAVIRLEYLRKRDVPVRVETRGTPAEGYRLAGTSSVPATVRIKGAESKVEGVTEVVTAPVDVGGLTESVTVDASLQLERLNLKLDGTLPKVTVQIEPVAANYRIRNVEVRVLGMPGATSDIRSLVVHVRAVTPDVLRTLSGAQVFATVDARGLGRGKHRVDVRVSLPPGVSLVKAIPGRVTVTVP